MQEFSSTSVSSYEAGSLADRLTEQSRDGWHVVAIVPTGSTVTAYLCRDVEADDGVTTPEPAAAEPATYEAATDEPATAPESVASDPEPVLAAIVPEPAPEPAADEPLSTASTDTASTDSGATDTGAAATGAAPAGWYADPAGRFELRYWDGGQWTEHVSRAGQQYTDPPVA